MGKIKSVLFVCTGNSCRSVMAEALMRKYLRDLGKGDVDVNSAGVTAIDGLSPSSETIHVIAEEGIDASYYKTKMLKEEMVKKADLILVMEDVHKEYILQLDPEAAAKTFLLKEYGSGGSKPNYPENHNIPDPIGKPIDYYKLSLEIIKDQVKRIAESI